MFQPSSAPGTAALPGRRGSPPPAGCIFLPLFRSQADSGSIPRGGLSCSGTTPVVTRSRHGAQSRRGGEESTVPPPRPPESFEFAFHGLVSETFLRNELGRVQQTAAPQRPSVTVSQPGSASTSARDDSARRYSVSNFLSWFRSSIAPDFPYLPCLFLVPPLRRLSAGLRRPINLLPLCCNPTRPSPPLLLRLSGIRS